MRRRRGSQRIGAAGVHRLRSPSRRGGDGISERAADYGADIGWSSSELTIAEEAATAFSSSAVDDGTRGRILRCERGNPKLFLFLIFVLLLMQRMAL